MISRVPVALLMLLLCCGAYGAEQPRRYALLLGNGKYAKLPSIPSVGERLKALQSALADAGFDVTLQENVTHRKAVSELVPAFVAKLHEGDICFVYFSGFAIQAEGNYLLPVDFDPASQQDISSRAYSLTGLQQTIDEKKPGLKIFVVEAERTDPKLMTQGIGLAYPDIGGVSEVLFAFPALPNQMMPELPATQAGLFTRYLVETIRKPGLNLGDVFRTVQGLVAEATAQRQQIFYLPNVTKDFYFHPPVAPAPTRTSPQTSSGDRQEYVLIPSGRFKMGCVPADTKCRPAEKPQHEVTITHAFWMGRTETTVETYQHYVDQDKKARKMPSNKPLWETKKDWIFLNHPITEVTWEEAESFCEAAGGRLPTEAEWEYAARAGTPDQINPSKEEGRDKANFSGKSGNDTYEYTAPVKSFDPNGYDLYDMAGNVWEWCKDWFNKDYFQLSPATDPQGPSAGKGHVVRGGSWESDREQYLRISFRMEKTTRSNEVGFRCVLPEDSPKLPGLARTREKLSGK